MRLLRRNTTEFEYLQYTGLSSDLNEDDEHTGEYKPVYAEPVTYKGNVSSPSGSVNQTFYGQDIRYTHTLVMDDPELPIHEGDMIRWKGEMYDIRAVRPSLNVLSIALRKQTSDNAEGEN